MPNITLSVSDEIKKKMESHPEVRWSNAIRATIERKISDFESANDLAKKSKLTEKDAKTLSEKAEKAMAAHARKLLNESNS